MGSLSLKDARAKFVQDQINREKEIHDGFNHLIEYKRVIKIIAALVASPKRIRESSYFRPSINDNRESNFFRGDSVDIDQANQISFIDKSLNEDCIIAGTINRSEKERFKRLVFRSTRGNTLVHFEDFTIPILDFYGKEIWKTVYLLVFPKGNILRNKLLLLCDSFLGERYDIPKGDVNEIIEAVNQRIQETKQLILATQEQITKYLFSINLLEDSDISAILLYKWFVAKEKALYSCLNLFKFGNSLLVGLFWAPKSEVETIYSKIGDIKEDRNITGPQIWERKNHSVPPPTYFRLNAFTAAFQEITNTYGVPCYKEVNPSLFAMVTFPFLFGVMFGDIGHGLILFFFFGLFLCILSEDIQKTPLKALYSARYLILLMGFFSTFCGVCYNDFMSIPIEYSTCYHAVREGKHEIGKLSKDCVVPIGIDSFWYLAENQLTYVNSMKMKISVIFGVTQMSLGILMKAMNSIHFSKPVDFIFEFIPQLAMLLCLFGFMDLLIIVTKYN